jgi:two-component system response regulator VicR
MQVKILVVDDEQAIVEILKSNLEREGFEVDTAYDGEEAVEKALSTAYDLILLDCMLPGKDGFDVCRQLRQESSVPIIMLTAKSEEIDKVLGLELGADDYITKPFSNRELLARIKAQLRRSKLNSRADTQEATGSVFVVADLVINNDVYEVTRNGENLNLTLREFQLLSFLAKNAGTVFSREELLEEVWDYDYYGDVRTVDVTVRRTREKIEPDPDNYRYIITKRGLGYYFNKHV